MTLVKKNVTPHIDNSRSIQIQKQTKGVVANMSILSTVDLVIFNGDNHYRNSLTWLLNDEFYSVIMIFVKKPKTTKSSWQLS
jgi:hypothetical protein